MPVILALGMLRGRIASLNLVCGRAVVAHTFNPNTHEAEADGPLESVDQAGTQKSACLFFPSAGTKDVCQHCLASKEVLNR